MHGKLHMVGFEVRGAVWMMHQISTIDPADAERDVDDELGAMFASVLTPRSFDPKGGLHDCNSPMGTLSQNGYGEFS